MEAIIPPFATYRDAFTDMVERRRDLPALTFLEEGVGDGVTWTYGELDLEARRVADQVRGRVAPGTPVILMAPPGLEYVAGFLGCMYAGAIAVPAYPPSPMHGKDHMNRLQAVAESAQVSVGLTTDPLLETVEGFAVGGQPVQWLSVSRAAPDPDPEAPLAPITGDDIAFLQYTSGSTGDPKGVIVTQANLMANCEMIREAYGMEPDVAFVSWLPPYHDMGLIGGLLAPAVVGMHMAFMPPNVFLRRPIRWLQVLTRFGGITTAPNFAYETCTEKIKEKDLAGLDLSRVRIAVNGAEPVRASTLERFAERFGPYGFDMAAFRPSYGLAETTVLATSTPAAGPRIFDADSAALERRELQRADPTSEVLRLVSSGRPPSGTEIRIVDPETGVSLPDGHVGEVEISGPHVTRGYWRRPEATAERFAGNSVRTGDLGCLVDGELLVTGRIKDVIIIRGRNYYPQDIELTVEESNPTFRRNCAAAFMVERDDRELLVVVQEVNPQLIGEPGPVVDQIRRAITAAHGVSPSAVVLTRPGKVPKTSSGKIRRSEARRRFEHDEIDSVWTWLAGQPLHAGTVSVTS